VRVGQLIYGPLADRFGRRVPLLSGVTLFTLASFACAYAPSLEWLIGARFVQALGGCAGMVISRAVVSDKCDAVGSAKVYSQLMLVTGLAPILAPLAGGLMVGVWGWQSIFLALSLFSVMAAIAVAVGLPETFPADQPRQPLSGSLRRYGSLLSDRVYLGYALTGGISIAGMFAYIAGSPFVFIKLYGVPATFSLESGDKATRAAGFAAQVNAGNVKLLRAPWNEALLNEFKMFPNGHYDDQVDACSRAFNSLDDSLALFMAQAQ